MFEWHRTIQRMVNIIEGQVQRGVSDELALGALAKELNYSPYHVTRRFKLLTGMTFRSYLRLRRLAYSVAELRDSDRRVLDIALKYGFSSQEAFSRAFKEAFGLTPGDYRLTKPPLVLHAKSNIFDPYFLHLGENSVTKKELQPVEAAIVTMPAHRFLFIKNAQADSYFAFWNLQEKVPGQDCDTITGLLDSISSKLDSVTGGIGVFDGQIGAYWYTQEGKKAYAYGIRLPVDFQGQLPLQMESRELPQRDYLVISHPPFAYEEIGASVFHAVEEALAQYDFNSTDFLLDKTAFTYQIHNPEHLGYRLYVPLKKS